MLVSNQSSDLDNYLSSNSFQISSRVFVCWNVIHDAMATLTILVHQEQTKESIWIGESGNNNMLGTLRCWSIKSKLNRAYEDAKLDTNDLNMLADLCDHFLKRGNDNIFWTIAMLIILMGTWTLLFPHLIFVYDVHAKPVKAKGLSKITTRTLGLEGWAKRWYLVCHTWAISISTKQSIDVSFFVHWPSLLEFQIRHNVHKALNHVQLLEWITNSWLSVVSVFIENYFVNMLPHIWGKQYIFFCSYMDNSW